jgi:DNA-binding transcriptional MerR regulator
MIKPQRTPKGHRLYTDQDIALIRRILQLMEQGVAIGQVKKILRQGGRLAKPPEARSEISGPWADYQARILDAAAGYDLAALEAVYNDALALYPLDQAARALLLPLLGRLQEQRYDSATAEIQEHLVRSFLRAKLGARYQHQLPQSQGPLLLLAGLPAEQGEVELLLFALLGLNQGYQVLSLGPDMPLEPLPEAVRDSACEGLVLFGERDPEPGLVHTRLPALVARCSVPVFVFGSLSERLGETLSQRGAIKLGEDPGTALNLIRSRLPSAE